MTVRVPVLASAISVFSSVTVQPVRLLYDMRKTMEQSSEIERNDIFFICMYTNQEIQH
jgi:hypothetical protein